MAAIGKIVHRSYCMADRVTNLMCPMEEVLQMMEEKNPDATGIYQKFEDKNY